MTQDTRKCSKCQRVLSLSDFFKNRQRSRGLSNRCKACDVARRNRCEKVNPTRKIWAKKNKEKIQAHSVANENKDILRKDSCETCGSKDKLQMHHPNYKKPMEVVTLCAQCHSNLHRNGETHD